MNKTTIIAITNPLIMDNNGLPLTAEEFISYTARVSNPGNQLNTATSEKLLAYCMRNSHWSVFEMVNVVMEIETTRDIARQILRHRSFSFQEFSQRYADPLNELGFVYREARLQDTKNRQNSIETSDDELQKQWKNHQEMVMDVVDISYRWAIEAGIAKEQARAILPEGLIKSRLYMNGTLRSWIHYCNLRMEPGTQKEHREIAESAWNNLAKYFEFLTKA
jgi:thymidylate synthase (FAD)